MKKVMFYVGAPRQSVLITVVSGDICRNIDVTSAQAKKAMDTLRKKGWSPFVVPNTDYGHLCAVVVYSGGVRP